jgi:hypothetical protein
MLQKMSGNPSETISHEKQYPHEFFEEVLLVILSFVKKYCPPSLLFDSPVLAFLNKNSS